MRKGKSQDRQLKLEISVAKKRDLVRLWQKGIIPSEYHSWYQELPSSGKKKNDCVEFNENENSDEDYNDFSIKVFLSIC
ncbi:MAG: hypothetical protein GY816_19565 [Cytophagales bacterium]|nr:hypothetical protein [Cytophagales bacterium]